jgi:small-conductance mechanosensitive channel
VSGCRHCGALRPPIIEFTPEGKLWRCLSCNVCERTPPPEDGAPVVPLKTEAQTQELAPAPPPEQEPETQAQLVKCERIKRASPPKPGDIVRQARRELRAVRQELKLLRKELATYEQAENELSRLLDAADGKLAVVRDIKQSTRK